MCTRRSWLLTVAVLAFCAAPLLAQEKKDEKKEDPKDKSGTVTGVLSAKGDPAKKENWIEIKADGEEKARRYVPNWVGGNTGGFDKDMLKIFKDTPVGSRVRLEWKFEERPRAVKLEVLKKAEEKKDK